MTPEQLAASGTEHGHQVAFFAWAATVIAGWCQGNNKDEQLGKLACSLKLMFAIPNGGLRHKAEANKLNSEGVKSGVPDIFLPVPATNYKAGFDSKLWFNGLFIEMKKPSEKPKNGNSKGGVSSNQAVWHTALRAQGYQVAVCYSWREARDVILAYLGVS